MNDLKYKVIFSGRRSIGVYLKPDEGLVVRAPYRTSHKTIERILHKNSAWIKKHHESIGNLKRVNRKKEYSDGEFHPYLGEEIPIRIKESSDSFVIKNKGLIEIGVKGTINQVTVGSLLRKWYMKEAKSYIALRFNDIMKKFRYIDFNPSELNIRFMKSRWGSCSSKGKITINAELIKLEPRFTEYVIIHELCHLKHHNHGKEFYMLLDYYYPDYKSVRKELRSYLLK